MICNILLYRKFTFNEKSIWSILQWFGIFDYKKKKDEKKDEKKNGKKED